MIQKINLTDSISFYPVRHVFVHEPTGYIMDADVVYLSDTDDIQSRAERVARISISEEDIMKMKRYIQNVETLYT